MGTDFWTSQIKNEDNAEDSPRRIAMMEVSPIGSPERSPEDGPEGSPEDDSDSDTTTTKSPAVTPDFVIGSKRSLIQRQNFPLRRFISEVVKNLLPFHQGMDECHETKRSLAVGQETHTRVWNSLAHS